MSEELSATLSETLTSAEAADLLQVRLETLYAYVSRGLVRSQPATGSGGREKVYLKEDVDRLVARKAIRRDPEKASSSVLRWGEPSLDSELTLISQNRFFYRGENVVRIAREHTFEQVASFFWSGHWDGEIHRYAGLDSSLGHAISSIAGRRSAFDWLALCQLGLILHEDRLIQSGSNLLEVAWQILDLFVALAVFPTELREAPSLSDALASSWNVYPDEARLIDESLSLCLDHELNISSFTARCASSAGASLHASLVAALSAFRGPKHGANILRAQAFLREVERERSVASAARLRRRRGESLPGFGHPLYPDEDPRAKRIFSLMEMEMPESDATRLFRDLRIFGRESLGLMPNIDTALAVLSLGLGLPDEAPIQIAAIGRSAGWIGHAIEQHASDQLIRPRARYTGRPPRRLGS